MIATIDSITQDALILPPDQRLALVNRLLLSLEPESDPVAAEAAWQVEIARRIKEYDAGLSKTIPAAEVFARFNREFKA